MFACGLPAVGGEPLASRGLPTFALCSCHHHTFGLGLCGWNPHHCLLHHHDAAFQASHYSLLSTMEVAGKLAFASVSGIIIDTFGLQVVLLLLLLLALLTPPLVPEQSGTQTTSEHK